jgi:hypothetical protein
VIQFLQLELPAEREMPVDDGDYFDGPNNASFWIILEAKLVGKSIKTTGIPGAKPKQKGARGRGKR